MPYPLKALWQALLFLTPRFTTEEWACVAEWCYDCGAYHPEPAKPLSHVEAWEQYDCIVTFRVFKVLAFTYLDEPISMRAWK